MARTIRFNGGPLHNHSLEMAGTEWWVFEIGRRGKYILDPTSNQMEWQGWHLEDRSILRLL